MLINKLKCPFGCEDAIISETVNQKINSNLLLDSTVVRKKNDKAYVCNCCGNIFETIKLNNKNKQVL